MVGYLACLQSPSHNNLRRRVSVMSVCSVAIVIYHCPCNLTYFYVMCALYIVLFFELAESMNNFAISIS
jgi:hypothetical protein